MIADLHIHTLLSPCGDIEMTPAAIVKLALQRGIDIIGITDHNSTLQAPIIKEIGAREGLHVVCGAEITTKEEVHLLAFVDGGEPLRLLQQYLESHLIKVPNNPQIFGYQLVVNEQEEILHQEENLLIGAISQEIDEVASFVHSIGGLVIPAHIDKKANSLYSQLGFLPHGLEVDAFEISGITNPQEFISQKRGLPPKGYICSSDAHYTDDIGRFATKLKLSSFSFEALSKAIRDSEISNFIR